VEVASKELPQIHIRGGVQLDDALLAPATVQQGELRREHLLDPAPVLAAAQLHQLMEHWQLVLLFEDTDVQVAEALVEIHQRLDGRADVPAFRECTVAVRGHKQMAEGRAEESFARAETPQDGANGHAGALRDLIERHLAHVSRFPDERDGGVEQAGGVGVCLLGTSCLLVGALRRFHVTNSDMNSYFVSTVLTLNEPVTIHKPWSRQVAKSLTVIKLRPNFCGLTPR